MNALAVFDFSSPWVARLGWGLVHSLWQGAAIACLTFVLLWTLRRSSAQLKYAIACGGLLLLAVVLTTTICLVQPPNDLTTVASEDEQRIDEGTKPTESAMGLPVVRSAPVGAETIPDEAVATPQDSSALLHRATSATNENRISENENTGRDSDSRDQHWFLFSWVTPISPWIVGLWLVGVLLLSLKHVGGWLLLERLRRLGVSALPAGLESTLERLCERMRVTRQVRLLESTRVQTPSLIGILRPVILFPGSALTGLSPGQLEAVLAHELAHIRRHDFLINLFQTAIETLLFYHPAVWLLSRRIRAERENCCDDLAIETCGDRVEYARALTELADSQSSGLAMAARTNARQLLPRIRRILGLPEINTGRHRGGWIVAGAVVLLMAGLLGFRAGAQTPVENPRTAAPIVGSPKTPSKPSKPKPVEKKQQSSFPPIDLGKERLHIETHPADKLPAGLFAVKPYPSPYSPSAQVVYQWRTSKTIGDGYHELVGRMPGGFDPGLNTFQVERFERIGSKITAVIRRIDREADVAGGNVNVYVRSYLPPLPPGEYTVTISLRDVTAKGDALTPAEKTRNPVACKFVVPANDPVAAELKKLAEASMAIKPKGPLARPRGRSDQSPTGLDLVKILQLTGQQKERSKFPTDNRYFAESVSKLVRAKRSWALCAVLDHANVDAKILAAEGLGKLADPATVTVLLAAAKNNNYFVDGSENATLHAIYRSALIRALQQTTGLNLVSRKLKNRIDYLKDQPDYQQVDAWLQTVFLAAAPGEEKHRKRAEKAEQQWGTLKGRFVFAGKPPQPERILPSQRKYFNGKEWVPMKLHDDEVLLRNKVYDESLLVADDGGVANVVIFLRNKNKNVPVHPDYAKTAKEKVTLTAKQGRFGPHVAAMRSSQPLVVHNAETFGVTFHLQPLTYAGFHVLMPAGRQSQQHVKQDLLPMRIKCNIHPWMSSWLLVRDDPYFAITGKDGRFRIENLPAGEWEFQVWHENRGLLKTPNWPKGRFTITVKPGDNNLGTIKVDSKQLLPENPIQVLREAKEAKDRGKLSEAYQKVRGGKHTKEDELLYIPGVQLNKYTDYASWFEVIKKNKELRPDTRHQHGVLFRSKQLDDNDLMWIERVERQGRTFVVTMQRAIWDGEYLRNTTFHELHGVDFGKLPAGDYRVKWIIRQSTFKKWAIQESSENPDKRWPLDAKPSDAKPLELTLSFRVVAPPKPAKASKKENTSAAVPRPIREDEDILDYAKSQKDLLLKGVHMLVGPREGWLGDPITQLKKEEEKYRRFADSLPRPRTVTKLVAMYRREKDDINRLYLLHILAHSRDPRAAILIGEAKHFLLFDGIFAPFASGGTPAQLAAAENWWRANERRLRAEAKVLQERAQQILPKKADNRTSPPTDKQKVFSPTGFLRGQIQRYSKEAEDLQRAGRLLEARQHADKAERFRRQLEELVKKPSRAEYLQQQIRGLLKEAEDLRAAGRLEEAKQHAEKAAYRIEQLLILQEVLKGAPQEQPK